ncbi:MAG: hypothetical protein ACTHZ9_13205 [Leucobacter sp.]
MNICRGLRNLTKRGGWGVAKRRHEAWWLGSREATSRNLVVEESRSDVTKLNHSMGSPANAAA